MRWLALSLAVAATAAAAPAAAQTYGYGYGYSQPYQGSDFDWRRCHTNESAAACRNRLQQRRDTRYGDYRYDYSRDYPRDNATYGYGSVYEYYADSARYGEYPYYGGYGQGGYYSNGYYGNQGGYYGNQGSYYGNGYYGNGYYGNGYGGSYRGYDSGAALALTVLGVALGAQILGTLDDRDHYYRYRDDRQWREWCRDRYNTFDWSSGTYLSSDGYRRYCRRS